MMPVIMLSARAGEESRIEGLDAGADDYLTKPFTARELVARVEAQLKMARLCGSRPGTGSGLDERDPAGPAIRLGDARTHSGFVRHPRSGLHGDLHESRRGAITASSGIPHLGRRLWDLYPMLLGTPVEEQFRHAMEERVPVEFEQYFRNEDSEHWFHFQLYPQPGEG